MKMGRFLLSGACALASVLPCEAMAATFTMRFSGAAFNNAATAVGSFTIDDAELARINATPNYNALYSAVSNLTLTVSGAAAGNGVFTTANFGPTFQFRTPSALDFSRELVGQTLSNGLTFGQMNQGGQSGDFNLFDNRNDNVLAPNGSIFFTLAANQGSGDRMTLTSLTTGAVPEPATWAMMLFGFGGLGYAMRRRPQVGARIRFA